MKQYVLQHLCLRFTMKQSVANGKTLSCRLESVPSAEHGKDAFKPKEEKTASQEVLEKPHVDTGTLVQWK
jgi:hypothetical protein